MFITNHFSPYFLLVLKMRYFSIRAFQEFHSHYQLVKLKKSARPCMGMVLPNWFYRDVIHSKSFMTAT